MVRIDTGWLSNIFRTQRLATLKKKLPENILIHTDWIEERHAWMATVSLGEHTPLTRAFDKNEDTAQIRAIESYLK